MRKNWRSVSLMFPRNFLEKNFFTKTCIVFTKAPTYFFRQKMDAKIIEIWKTPFSIWNQIFSLGAFTGYPVLPGVSASLSDGKREYRGKQMSIAMVTQSSSEHDLQKLLGV